MFKQKTTFALIFSAIAIAATAVIAIACTSQEDMPDSGISIVEESAMDNDTIYIETEAPIIRNSDIASISVRTYDLVQSLTDFSTRSTSDTEVYYLYDDMTEKSAFAIANPSVADGWIFECYGREKKEPVIILFEQVESNVFVTKDKDGNILRYFTYDPDKRELWTSNNQTRGMSKRDQILCNSAFTTLGWLIGEALAIPSGGTSLLMGLGFTVASSYICE